MDPINFCYWLQGCFELNPGKSNFSAEEIQVLKNHLNMVFHHIDQTLGDKKHLEELGKIHTETVDFNPTQAVDLNPPNQKNLTPRPNRLPFDPHNTKIMC